MKELTYQKGCILVKLTIRLDIVSDIVDIPLEDESIDAILCVEVLEHVENPLLVFKEFSRLLKKVEIVSCPI